MHRGILSLLSAASAAGTWACAGDLSHRGLEEQLAAGARVYERSCAPCHDLEGAIGPELTARVLASHATAGGLDRYLRITMPYGDVASVNDQEYWDVLAYLVASRSLADLKSELLPAVADTLTLAH